MLMSNWHHVIKMSIRFHLSFYCISSNCFIFWVGMFWTLGTDLGFVSFHVHEENWIPWGGLATEVPHPAWNCTGRKLPAQHEPSSASSWLEDSEYLTG